MFRQSGIWLALCLGCIVTFQCHAALVPAGSTWKYLDDGSDQGTAWRSIDYEDDGWLSGPAQLGYGDGDEATVVEFGPDEDNKYITTYFRHIFELTDTNGITNLVVRLLRDDGGIVYLNGVEVFRSNMPTGAVNYLTPAGGATGSSTTFHPTNAHPRHLVLGRNLLAVEIHQSAGASSDLSFDLELIAGGANDAPSVSITRPSDNSVITAPGDVLITASATDSDGTVAKVEFYVGNRKLGEDTTRPFSLVWSNMLPGAYTLYVIATDDLGFSAKSLGSEVTFGSGNSNVVLVPAGATWKYLDNGSNQGTNWRQAAFNDSAWQTGPAELGYGDNDEATLVSYGGNSNSKFITTYFRTSFQVPDAAAVSSLSARLLRDDGAVVYLNGVEVFRSNMPTGAITYTTLASTATADEETFFRRAVDPALLVNGINVLAVEVHQSATNSSDLSFDFELLGSDFPSVLRGPWLQVGTPHSVMIKWRTDIACDSRVRYGTSSAALSSAVSGAALTTEHAVTLTNLTPATTYYYSIGTAARPLLGSDDFFFRTPPLPGTPQRTRIWAIGDSGTANVDAQNVREAYYRFAGSDYTHLFLMLGDNAYNDGEDDEYQAAVFETYPTMLRQSVIWPTIGNHETDQSSTPPADIPYYQIFSLPRSAEAGGIASGTEDYYSFDYANIHFVCLDSMTSSRNSGSDMLDWLQNDLASSTQQWLVAFWHHPPYSKGSHDSDASVRQTEMRENVLPVLEDYGVDLVLCGHSHAYERSYLIDGHYGLSSSLRAAMIKDGGDGQVNGSGAYLKAAPAGTPHYGAVYIVAGSSGKVSGGTLDHPAMFISLNRLGSLVIDVEGPALDVRFLRENGDIADYFTLLKAPLLDLATAPGGVILSWPTNAAGFRLEESPDMIGPWMRINDPPAVLGNRFVITEPALEGTRFYRLAR
jgi:hypothetical protein